MTDETDILKRCNRVLDFLHKQFRACGEVPQIAETARRLAMPYQDTRNAYLRLVAEGRVIMYSCGRNSFYEFPPNERRRLPTTPRPDTPKDELYRAYAEMEI